MRNVSDLEDFAVRVVSATARNTVPLALKGWACRGDLGEWARVDRLTHATMSNHVTRAASEAVGSALIRVAGASFPAAAESVSALKKAARADPTLRCHMAPLFGFICRELSLSEAATSRMLVFTTLRDLLSAATRLNLVGPLEANRLQSKLAAKAEAIVLEAAANPFPELGFEAAALQRSGHAPGAAAVQIKANEAQGPPSEKSSEPSLAECGIALQVACWQTDPLLDLIQGCHDHLYSRLFVS